MRMRLSFIRRSLALAAGALTTCAAVAMLAAPRAEQSQDPAQRVSTGRPAGWDRLSHGEDVRPDYSRVFSTDVVHEIRIVIAPDRFAAMQSD